MDGVRGGLISILSVAFLLTSSAVNAETNASGKESSDKSAIKIGFIASLTGAGAMPSRLLVNGAKLYLDQVNNRMAGKPVQLIVVNDETNPATAIAKVKELAEQDKVNLISGVFFTHIAYAILPQIEKYQVPFVDATAAGDDVTQRKRSNWCIRTSSSASQQTHALGEYAYKTLGYKRIATIAAALPYGYEQVGGFQQSFEDQGGQIVQKLWTPVGFTDFTTILKTLRKDVDAVFMCNVGNTALTIPKQMKELGYRKPLLGGPSSFDDSVIEKLGEDGAGGISAQPYTCSLDTATNKAFVKAYKQKFGTDPSFYSENGYLAMAWIDKAIQSVKGQVDNKQKLMQALRSVELADSPRGPVKLDSFGNPVINTYILKMQKSGNTYKNVVLKTYPNTSQFWTWQPEQYLKQPVYEKDYPPCKHCSDK